jgi:hypothetical protein
VPEFFFEAAARRGQIGRVHQRHGVGLQTLPMQQPTQQMLVDPPQPAHAHLLAELRKHPRRGELSSQTGEPAPGGLFGKLRHDQVEGVGGGEHRQQMRSPELRRAQVMASSTGESARTKPGDEVIGHIIAKPLEQGNGANGRQRGNHACTLTRCVTAATPLVSAQTSSNQTVTKTFGTPSRTPFNQNHFA